MNLSKILSYVVLAIAAVLAYFLVDGIKFKIDETERIAQIEERVIEKLKMIRDAQKAYQSSNGQYTDNWDSLLNFIETGKIWIIERKETTTLLDYGQEEITVTYDTLGSVQVMDSLFSADKVPNFRLETLPIIPGSNGKRFELFADKIEKSGVMVSVFEVRDVAPVNPARRKNNNEKALRVGSRTDVSTAGNWE